MTQAGKTKVSYPRQKITFCISGDNKGLACPFKPVTCQEGYCCECRIYLDRKETMASISRNNFVR